MTKIMTLLTALLIYATPPSNASAQCLEVDQQSVKVKWKAFKTPLKLGVGGIFKKIKVNGKLRGKSIKEIMNSTPTFSIDGSSVFSKNSARDKKLAKFIFSTLSGGALITGKVKAMTKKALTLEVTMNRKKLELPLRYTIVGNKLEAKGTIDMFDYAMQDEVSAINKACLALHEGKTWSDVDVELHAKFNQCK